MVAIEPDGRQRGCLLQRINAVWLPPAAGLKGWGRPQRKTPQGLRTAGLFYCFKTWGQSSGL